MAADRQLRAMGTDVHLIVNGPEALLDVAVDRIEQLESRWSRFRPESEVSRLNDRAGDTVEVSDDTVLLVERAVEAYAMSAGFVDCTLLEALEAAGYDRSFDTLPGDRSWPPTAPHLVSLLGPADISVHGHAVRLPCGLRFDPGGIGKGLAADLVAGELAAAGAEGACVNLGGDLRVWGEAPGTGTWTVSVDHPHQDTPVALLGLAGGGVATSTTLRRVWSVGGQARHHLIDPGTGLPSTSALVFVTVVAGEAWVAEVLAKAVLLRGGDHPFDLVDGTGVDAVVVDRDGSVRCSPGLERFLGGVPLAPALRTEARPD